MTNVQTTTQSWTYLDVMALIVALTKKTRFSSSPLDWHSTWYEITQMPEARELLSEVHFELREPYVPFSKQVEASLDGLRRSGILLTSLRRHPWKVEDEDKTQIILGNLRLKLRHGVALERMASRLDEELGVPAP